MWVALDPVQTLLVDSLKVIMNSSGLKLALHSGFLGFESELVLTENNNILNVSYKEC